MQRTVASVDKPWVWPVAVAGGGVVIGFTALPLGWSFGNWLLPVLGLLIIAFSSWAGSRRDTHLSHVEGALGQVQTELGAAQGEVVARQTLWQDS